MPNPAQNPERVGPIWTDFSGGMSEAPPTRLAPNQAHFIENWFPFGGRLIPRRGVQAISRVPCPEEITSVQTFVEIDRAKATNQLDFTKATFVCGGLETIWTYDPSNYWRQVSTAAIQSGEEPWTMRQYNNAIYLCRRGAGLRVIRDPFTTAYAAGIPAPAIGNIGLTVRSDGPLDAGSYEYVVTFRNSVTRAEGGRSPASRVTVSSDGKKVFLANIPQPPAGSQANEIRIWRSLRIDEVTADEFDEYYYLDTVVSGTTTYEDSKEQITLGALLGRTNLVPPGDVFLFDIWEERAWLSNGRELIWSEVAQPEAYYSRNRMLIGPDDGSIVTALCAWDNRLMVSKTEQIFYMLHTGPNEFSREVFSDKQGCWASGSMRAMKGLLIFFGGDGFYRSNGESPFTITDTRLEKTIEKIPFENRHEVYAALYPRQNWYLASIPQREDGDDFRIVLGYNYRDDAWFRFRHFQGGLSVVPEATASLHWIREVPGGNLDDGMLAVSRDHHIYQYDKGTVDREGAASTPSSEPRYDSEIVCTLRTAAIPLQSGIASLVRRVKLLADIVRGVLRVKLVRDEVNYDKSVEHVLRPATQQRRWSLFNLNSEAVGRCNQIEIEYQGEPMSVEGVGAEVTLLPERDQRAR